MMSYITSTLSRLSLKARQIQRLAAQCHTRKSPKRRVGNGSSRQESNLDKAGLFQQIVSWTKQCSYDLRQRATEAHGSACVRHYGHRQKENMPAKSSAISEASYVSRSKFSSHSMIRESPLA